MDRIQSDALKALNNYIKIIKDEKEREYPDEYSETYSTQLWTLCTLKEELLLHDEAPLIVIERFGKRMLKYSYDNEIFKDAANVIEDFIHSLM